jgi:DnaJ-class molecular chaperone
MKKTTGMTDEVRECLAEMGVTEAVFAKIRSASNHTDGAKFLDEAKDICRKGFRAIATTYHPDHNQHLPADEIKTKEERFKRLRSVHDSFQESKYRGPRRSNTQMGAINFDPFGFSSMSHEDMVDQLRHWQGVSPDVLREVARRREEQRARAIEILQQAIKRDLNKK